MWEAPDSTGAIPAFPDMGGSGPGLELSVGAYRNSYGRGSLAATVALPVARWRDGEVSIFAGAALYPQDGRQFRAHLGDLVPMAGCRSGTVLPFFKSCPRMAARLMP